MVVKITGKVLNVEISEMSGVKYGNILVEDSLGNRHKLKFDANSEGMIPERESYVDVTYDESNLNRIVKVAYVAPDMVPTEEESSSIRFILNPFNFIVMLPLVLLGGLSVLMSFSQVNLVGLIFMLAGGIALFFTGLGIIVESLTDEIHYPGVTGLLLTFVGWAAWSTERTIPLYIYGLIFFSIVGLFALSFQRICKAGLEGGTMSQVGSRRR